MSLQTLQPEVLSELISPFHNTRRSLTQWSLTQSQRTTETDTPDENGRPAVETMMTPHIDRLLFTDPDERLDYLKQENSAFNEERLNQLATIMDNWLNDGARSRMRDSAQESYDNSRDAVYALKIWVTPLEIQRLATLFDENPIPDLDLALSYAVCEAYDLACSIYFIRLNRANRQVDFSGISQTSEEIDADIRFVNAR